MIADWDVKHQDKQNINMDSMSGLDNSMDPDQLASLEASWSGSTLFDDIKFWNCYAHCTC